VSALSSDAARAFVLRAGDIGIHQKVEQTTVTPSAREERGNRGRWRITLQRN
jgi:hypothetical protein